MKTASLLIGGPIIAAIIGTWGYVKGIFGKLRSAIIINVHLDGVVAEAMSFYCWENFKRMRLGDRRYGGCRGYIRSVEKYRYIAFEKFSESSIVFWNGIKPICIMTEEKKTDSHIETESVSITFIRGTFDPDALIQEAVDLYNKHYVEGFQHKRFYVSKRYGSLITPQPGKVQHEESSITSRDLWDKRLVGFSIDDIGEKIHSSGEPFESLAFPKCVWDAVRDIHRWKESERWYKDKGIPWKRGWLIHGPPGTGKTSLVRAIGEYLDIPIISFALSSFTDNEFQEEWDDLNNRVPCIALVEDIDTVFKGRTNIVKSGYSGRPLNFDTLLNTIDGISLSDGVFTIITTNNPDYLDPALCSAEEITRPGRIDLSIGMDVLEKECRKQIANRILSDCPELVDEIIKDGEGDTGAQFQNRCSKVALDEFWSREHRS